MLDESGKPLTDATVFIGTGLHLPTAQTGADGSFHLVGVPPGHEIGLAAYKTSDGYPYAMFAFFQSPGEELPFVEVLAGQTTEGVIIRLGERAAYLKIDVTDEFNNPINPGLQFSRPDNEKYGAYSTSTGARELLLVPPVPFRLTITANGYKPWHFGGDQWQAPKGLIILKSGEKLDLRVRLEKPDGTEHTVTSDQR